jgi:hypothetical protein
MLEYSIQSGGDLMTAEQTALNEQADKLYEQYGQPLEREHWGEYIAIFPDGQTVLGTSPHEVLDKALDTIGRGSFLFKIGEKAVGKWLSPRIISTCVPPATAIHLATFTPDSQNHS